MYVSVLTTPAVKPVVKVINSFSVLTTPAVKPVVKVINSFGVRNVVVGIKTLLHEEFMEPWIHRPIRNADRLISLDIESQIPNSQISILNLEIDIVATFFG